MREAEEVSRNLSLKLCCFHHPAIRRFGLPGFQVFNKNSTGLRTKKINKKSIRR
jgi:hypothetical protein